MSCPCFVDEEMLLVINFDGKNFFTEKMEAILTITFKIRAKLENIFQCVSLRRRVCFYRQCVSEALNVSSGEEQGETAVFAS